MSQEKIFEVSEQSKQINKLMEDLPSNLLGDDEQTSDVPVIEKAEPIAADDSQVVEDEKDFSDDKPGLPPANQPEAELPAEQSEEIDVIPGLPEGETESNENVEDQEEELERESLMENMRDLFRKHIGTKLTENWNRLLIKRPKKKKSKFEIAEDDKDLSDISSVSMWKTYRKSENGVDNTSTQTEPQEAEPVEAATDEIVDKPIVEPKKVEVDAASVVGYEISGDLLQSINGLFEHAKNDDSSTEDRLEAVKSLMKIFFDELTAVRVAMRKNKGSERAQQEYKKAETLLNNLYVLAIDTQAELEEGN